MRRFPRRENEVAELASLIVVGLLENPDDFPSPPIAPEELKKTLDTYWNARNQAVNARAALAEAVKAKDGVLKTLVRDMKLQLSYAEHAVGLDNSKLEPLGWRKRKEPTPMQPPGQPRNLEAIREGPGVVLLDWKTPSDGGLVAFYQIRVCHSDSKEWIDGGRCFETSTVLENQERGKELAYRVVAINKAGEGMPSNEVSVFL